MSISSTPDILDVTLLEPRMKHPTIFTRFDQLPDGATLVIHNDHDPKPLYYQLLGERGNIFEWEYLQQGPDWWKVAITKKADRQEETIGQISAKDLRKAQVFKKYGLDLCCGSDKTVREACAEKGLDITRIEQELQMAGKVLPELSDDQVTELDVRPMLAAGNDPLNLILQTVKGLKAGQTLKIVNSFKPLPLIHLLEKQDFESHCETPEKGLVITWFHQKAATAHEQEPKATVIPREELPTQEAADDWDALLESFQGKLQTIDVRALEMPRPMITILETLEQLPEDTALFVYHKRVPVFLLPELADMKLSYLIKEPGDSEVHLLIFRK